MKVSYRIVLLILGMFPLMSTLAFSVPGLISYKGQLTDASGGPITTSVDVTFTLWDAETGGNQLGGAGGSTEVMDQQQTDFGVLQTGTIAQSFTAQITGTLTKIRIQAWDYYAGGSNTVTIIDGGDPNGATVLATQTFSMSGGAPQWNDIIFGSPASVVAGQQYCFVFYCCGNAMQINRATDNPYSGGIAFDYDTMAMGFTPTPGGTGDYVFETYVTGGSGFSDTDSVTPNADGIYDTLIGDDNNQIPGAVFGNDSVWLNVNVDGEDLAPRTRLTPVGAALHAGSADTATTAGDADTVDGVEGADIISNTNAISAEATTARAAEQANAAAISTEAATARAAENTIASAITAETSRAQAAEQANANAILANAAGIAAIDTSGIADNATSISALMALIVDLQNHTHETPKPHPTPPPTPKPENQMKPKRK